MINYKTKSYLIYFLLYVGLSVAYFSVIWANPSSRWVGIQGDANTFMWYLAWVAHSMVRLNNPLVTNYLMFPQGVNLMWNTSVIIPGVLLTPFTLGLGPIFSFNLFSTLSLSVSAFTSFVAFNHFTTRKWPAFIGGLLYGFSPYMIAQSYAGHPNLTFAWYPPVVLILVNSLIIKKSSRRWHIGIALGIATAVQLLTTEEIVATTAIGVIVLLFLLALRYPNKIKDRLLYSIGPLTAGLLVALLLTALPLYIQFFGPQAIHVPLQTSNVYVTDLANLVIPTPFLNFSPSWAGSIYSTFSGNNGEWDGYLGIPLLIFVLVVPFLIKKNSPIKIAAVFSLIITIFSFGPQLHVAGKITSLYLPWYQIQKFPLLKNILPSRMMNLTFLSIGLLMAMSLDYLVNRFDPKGVTRGALIVGLCFYPLVPILKVQYQTNSTPKFFTTNAVKQIPANSVALVVPYPLSFLPELWQAESHFRYKMPQGDVLVPTLRKYGVRAMPPVTSLFYEMFSIQQSAKMEPLPKADILGIKQQLLQDKVKTVIIGPFYSGTITLLQKQAESESISVFTKVLNKKPTFDKGVYLWKNINQLLVPKKVIDIGIKSYVLFVPKEVTGL